MRYEREQQMIKLQDIIDFLKKEKVKFEFIGDFNDTIIGFSSLGNYKPGTITWCKTDDDFDEKIKSGYKLLVSSKHKEGISDNCIVTVNPKAVFFPIIENFFQTENELPDVGHGTYISSNVKIGKNVRIGYNCVIDGDISIGDNTVIYNNVTIINNVDIGENCVIHSGTVIGHDDYSYIEDEEHRKRMIKHYGGVDIGNDVLIGPLCVINRGTIDNTVIEEGCKIDAQCLVSHNARLGKHSALVGGAKIYGSVETGENFYIASAMIKNQLKAGKNVVVGMGSVVLKDIDDDTTVIGIPAKPLIK